MNSNVSFRQFILNHGLDKHHYESLLVLEVSETSTPLFRIHNSIQRRAQLLALILYRYLYIIYYIIIYYII